MRLCHASCPGGTAHLRLRGEADALSLFVQPGTLLLGQVGWEHKGGPVDHTLSQCAVDEHLWG